MRAGKHQIHMIAADRIAGKIRTYLCDGSIKTRYATPARIARLEAFPRLREVEIGSAGRVEHVGKMFGATYNVIEVLSRKAGRDR